jgi:hypothetical protein
MIKSKTVPATEVNIFTCERYQGFHSEIRKAVCFSLALLMLITQGLNEVGAEEWSKPTSFAELDADADGKISRSEFPSANVDVLEHVDSDFDSVLSEEEYGAYWRYLKRLNENRKLIPEGVVSHLGLAYVKAAHQRHRLDLYLPANSNVAEPLPLVIWIHGGGWQKDLRSPRSIIV